MKKGIAIAILLFCACIADKNNPISKLPLDHNGIQMKVGDSWLYRNTWIFEGLQPRDSLPDTLVMNYTYCYAEKETTIDSKKFLIINGREYNIDKDTVDIYKGKFAIHFSDSAISMLTIDLGNNHDDFKSVFKTTTKNMQFERKKYGKKISINNKLFADYRNYLYGVKDFVYPIIYPLIQDSIYDYRDSSIINWKQSLPMHRKFCGIETVNIPAGTFEAYKFDLLWKENFFDTIVDDSVQSFDWIGAHGLLKHYSYESKAIITYINTDTCPMYGIYEFIGSNDINPDTIVPWGKKISIGN
jgi:hypothetical protein